MNNTSLKVFLSGSLVAFAFLLLPNAAFASFSDVPETSPQAKAIDALQLQNIVHGYPDGTFKPDQLVTKGEFLKMAFNDIGYRQTPGMYVTPFIDVPADNWTAPYIKKALELNIISANGAAPTFNPTGDITRVNAIKTSFAISGIATPYYTSIDPSELFQDVSANAWYRYLARAAKLNGIISLKHPEFFWAQHLMTRGDAAELIYEVQTARDKMQEAHGTISVSTPTTNLGNLDTVSSQFINNPEFSVMLDVWKQANTNFYYKENVNQNELIYGAIKGMVDKLGDQYTIFEEPSDALGLQQYLQGEFEGIGIVIDLIDNKMVIMKVLPGSPAEEANLKTGDVIEKINNQSVDTLTINQAVDLIKGNAGTSVHLTILRNTQTLEIDVTRAQITLSSVSGKMIGNIGYIDVTEFIKSTPADFTSKLDELNKESPRGYILDLRDNPGGYLDSALQMLGHFIESDKTVLTTKKEDGSYLTYHTDGPAELKGKPLVVLVNGDTASASEIMAGAIQDFKLGKLVGVTTYGKGSVQEITNYSDNSLLKMSVAHWLTPNGRDINGIGLTPDVSVALDQTQLLQGTDTQLQKALQVINGM